MATVINEEPRRRYVRSLCFVLQVAVRRLFPEKVLIIDYSLPSGLYCEIRELEPNEDGAPVAVRLTWQDFAAIRSKMQELIDADLRFEKKCLSIAEAEALFLAQNQPQKASLIQTMGRDDCPVWYLDGCADTFYDELLDSTASLKVFDITDFKDGFVLQYPFDLEHPCIVPMKDQSKIAASLKRHSTWCSMIKVKAVGSLNNAILSGRATDLINMAELRHSWAYTDIAQQIYNRREHVKIVFIAGPSSSGKTSTSLRLALCLRVLGLNPKVIELDNYFVNREDTPKDENGDYDFESLYAMDLPLLGRQLNSLLAGETVNIPRFDFVAGCQVLDEDRPMKLEEKDILIMEGIHALNPEMIPDVNPEKVFRVYASALTSLSLDENNNISTADNRMIRRIVRDNRTRGVNPEGTIMRWASVRRGENKNIFPFQENADAVFNSALIFELPMLKYYAEPLLRRIGSRSPAYAEAQRLLKLLDFVVPLSPDEISAIPPTSIAREFIGGQRL